MSFLIDECLHTSLVAVALSRGSPANHIAWLGRSGHQDWSLMTPIREQSLTFVTNNARDFRKLYAREPLHAGLIILVPNVTPSLQRALFQAALDEVGAMVDLINEVIEVSLAANEIRIDRYDLFKRGGI